MEYLLDEIAEEETIEACIVDRVREQVGKDMPQISDYTVTDLYHLIDHDGYGSAWYVEVKIENAPMVLYHVVAVEGYWEAARVL